MWPNSQRGKMVSTNPYIAQKILLLTVIVIHHLKTNSFPTNPTMKPTRGILISCRNVTFSASKLENSGILNTGNCGIFLQISTLFKSNCNVFQGGSESGCEKRQQGIRERTTERERVRKRNGGTEISREIERGEKGGDLGVSYVAI